MLVKTGSIFICATDFVHPFTPQTFVSTDPYGRAYTIGGDGSLQCHTEELPHHQSKRRARLKGFERFLAFSIAITHLGFNDLDCRHY